MVGKTAGQASRQHLSCCVESSVPWYSGCLNSLAENQHVKVNRSKFVCHKGCESLLRQFVSVVDLLAITMLF